MSRAMRRESDVFVINDNDLLANNVDGIDGAMGLIHTRAVALEAEWGSYPAAIIVSPMTYSHMMNAIEGRRHTGGEPYLSRSVRRNGMVLLGMQLERSPRAIDGNLYFVRRENQIHGFRPSTPEPMVHPAAAEDDYISARISDLERLHDQARAAEQAIRRGQEELGTPRIQVRPYSEEDSIPKLKDKPVKDAAFLAAVRRIENMPRPGKPRTSDTTVVNFTSTQGFSEGDRRTLDDGREMWVTAVDHERGEIHFTHVDPRRSVRRESGARDGASPHHSDFDAAARYALSNGGRSPVGVREVNYAVGLDGRLLQRADLPPVVPVILDEPFDHLAAWIGRD